MKFYYSKWVQNVYPLLINTFALELPALARQLARLKLLA